MVPCLRHAAAPLLLLIGCATPEVPPLADGGTSPAPDLRAPGPLLRPPPLMAAIAEIPGEVPLRLSVTGLYADIATRRLAEGVTLFKPTYELWSDAAEKTRYISLPKGAKIDSTSMDRWIYPEGVRLWKEFRKGGKLLETRLLWKRRDRRGQLGWDMVTYVWDDNEREAYREENGVLDARGTGHEIPRESDCKSCHVPDLERPLGFQALQLSGAGTGVRLRDLVQQGLLTQAPPSPDGYVVPGDATAQRALGYLHANCGGCHTPDSTGPVVTPMELRLLTGQLASVVTTPTYRTTVNMNTVSNKGGQVPTPRIKPGDAAGSAIYQRMGIRLKHPESLQMPPAGSNQVDATGRAAVAAWIMAL